MSPDVLGAAVRLPRCIWSQSYAGERIALAKFRDPQIGLLANRAFFRAVSLMLHLAELLEVPISAIRLDVSPFYQHRPPLQVVGSILRGCLQTTILRSYPVKESTSTGRISPADSYHVAAVRQATHLDSPLCQPIQEHDSIVVHPKRIFQWRQVFAVG
jgi:hypothetical protein